MIEKPNILFLADTTHPASAVFDHIQSITSSDSFTWHVLNPLLNKTIDKLDLSSFDAIGLHYSIKPYNNYYLSKSLQRKLTEYQGVKFLFLQDEYQRVNEVQDFLYRLGVDLLFTLVDDRMLSLAYPDPRLQKLNKIPVLTAYVTDEMKKIVTPPIAQRNIDVSYRGRRYDYWLGSLAYEKEWIAGQFLQRTEGYGLQLDISVEEENRVYGQKWLDFLANSKAVLGTESGASIWDFDRSIEKKTNEYLRSNKNANFEEVFNNVLKPYDGNIIYSAISPRIFEAAATKTPMVMFPGYYSGICMPDVHYIPLQKDFSNLDDVLNKLKDINYLQTLANNTFEDLILSDKYSQYQFSKLIAEKLNILITKKEGYTAKETLADQLEQNQKQYKALNAARLLATESHFVCVKFLSMLNDPKVTLSGRINILYKGFKRYMVYLLARFNK